MTFEVTVISDDDPSTIHSCTDSRDLGSMIAGLAANRGGHMIVEIIVK